MSDQFNNDCAFVPGANDERVNRKLGMQELYGIRRHVVSALGVLTLVVVWAILAAVVGNHALLPTPQAVAGRLVRDMTNPVFLSAVRTTVVEATVGCVVGSFFALILAYVIFKNEYVAAAFAPIVAISQAIPSVAIAPLLVIWLGYGVFAISVLCALMVFFPILVTAVLGFESMPRDVLEAAMLDGASGWSMLRFMEAPLALPALLAGLRTGFTLSVIGAVVGEFVMGGRGLGARLSLQSAAADMTGLFSTVTVLCSLAALAFATIAMIERRSAIVQSLSQKVK
ncbi:ABC transporter permease [Corynebacterium choanae]|uniref:Carnitine transport permease protein OpuCD n=1 Tax=Corynebacterium choanae TaxID=1862358 RepID=A0A3G6J8V4_9CORY|nr:ABC transporter permease subunit [Corynebacterium choanae]AZA14416.1 Carnitine transport permease protein OpuCD [Corynebacterium choanae]